MAKTNYQYERRQRELKKAQQQEEKRDKKRARREHPSRSPLNPEQVP